ncbi:MAG: beta strand repeat-containing protein, partial [Limisphaerales bacterium]
GSAVTFSATVSGSGGTPTGTVVFYDGANNLGSGTLNGSGMASFSTSALSASGSPHSMTAVYSGNSTFAGSSSSVLLQSVLTSTTILTTSQNPAAAGSVVTFTATVSGSGGTPTGTVVFYDGTSSLGNGTLNGSGVAALSTAALSVGGSPHSITAIYGGNSTFGGSSSGVLSQSILNPTTTALTSSQNPAQAGSVVTFTATVSGAGGIPTGTVVFNDGGSSLGSGTLNGSGVASFGTSALSASGSPHSMTAVYTGNGTFAASSSSVLSQTITNSNTNISFTVTNGLSARWSFDEGFGAIVADSSGNGNTGTLNDSPVWVAGLSGNNALEFPGSIVPGAAYVSVPNSATLADQGLGSNITICAWVKRSPASIGTYSSVVAKDIPFDSAPYHRNYELIFDSASHVDFAYRNSAGTTWETYASEPIYPDTANWHFYCVTYTYGNASSCTFYVDGSEVSGSWTVGNGSDAPASTSGGPVLIGIDGTGTTSSGSIYQQISIYNVALPASVVLELYTNAISGGLASATTVTSSQNPALAGGEVTFRATVSGNGGTPTGAVIFYDGTNSLGMGTLNSSGVASLSTGALSVTGLPHAITVVYDGDGVFGGSSSSVLSQIVINASTTAVTSSQNPAVAGNAVTFTATVTGSGGMPTGTVVFYDGVNDLGSVNLNASSVAVLSTSALSVVGSPHSITAVYSGDTNFEGSSSSVLSQIILSASTTTLTSSQNPAPAGSVVTFSATVRGSGGQPTGTVVFFDGSSNLGIGTLNGGVAVLSTSALSVGGSPHSITAVYSGDSAYGVSSSSVLSQDITTPSTITIASLQNPAPSGSVVTFAATVAGSGGVPTGNVDFYDGTSSLGIVGLNGLGVAVFSTSALSVGGSPHAIMAVYGGDSAFGGSTSSVLSQVISNFSVAPSAITVSSSQNPAPVGSMVSLSATVSGAGGTPTGTVVFFDGNNDLGSETLNGLGVASLSTSALSASGSPHAITAVYGGNSAFGGSSSSVLSQIITNLSIGASSIMISSSQNPALPGSAVTFIATVSGSSGVPAGTVNFFDGANSLGTGTLNNLGVTALSTAALSTGGSPHAITAVYAGNSYFASSKSSVLSQIISSTSTGASNIWELTQRLAYTAVPVADFRPTVTNSVMVVDEMPNGNPTDAGNGVVWDDLCLEDCFTNDATVVHALHVATHSNFMEISSQAYNGGEPLPLLFGQGYGNLAFTTMAAGISGNIFYAYNGIGGVTDGSSAAPGTVGEFISSSRTDYLPLTTGTTVNIAAINLTAGDWDVEGVASFVFFNSATVLSSSAGISTVSATNPSDGSAVASGLQLEAANMTYNSIPIFSTQLSFSSTTTVYLVGTCFFTAGDVSAFGQITARRMR